MDANRIVRMHAERRQHDIVTTEDFRRQGFDRRGPVTTDEESYKAFWDISKDYVKRIFGPH